MSPTTPAPPASTTEPALTPYSTVHIPPITSPTSAHRLGMRPSTRAALAGASGLAIGGILGASKGGLAARLRFRAENAHRLPRTTRGWYFYHKSKNYHVLLAGIKEAARMGGRIGFWGAVLFTLEAQVDRARAGRKDFLSTTIAGGTVAGLFSAFNRVPLDAAAKIARIGFGGGLVFGLLQDALWLASGQRLGYVDFLLGRGAKDDAAMTRP